MPPRRDQHRPVPCVSGYSVRDALAIFRMPLLVPSPQVPCLRLTTSLMWTSAIPMRVFICGHTWILPEHATKAVLHVLMLYTRGFLVHFHSANCFAGFPQLSEMHLGLSHRLCRWSWPRRGALLNDSLLPVAGSVQGRRAAVARG